MSELMLVNTKRRNLFAFVELAVLKKRRVGFKVEVVKYNKRTEENEHIRTKTMGISEFDCWCNFNGWKTAEKRPSE